MNIKMNLKEYMQMKKKEKAEEKRRQAQQQQINRMKKLHRGLWQRKSGFNTFFKYTT